MTNPITPAELEAWRALCEKRPPSAYVTSKGGVVLFNGPFPMNEANPFGDLIEALPRLLDEIARLQAECDRLRALAKELRDELRYASHDLQKTKDILQSLPAYNALLSEYNGILARPDVKELEG